MDEKPVCIQVPGTLEHPSMVLQGPVVDSLPEFASIGDLVTWQGNLYIWTGAKWVKELSDD